MPPINEADIKKAVLMLPKYLVENNTFEIKAFMHQYIDSIVVGKETVEVTLKVASAIFNAQYPDDQSGKVLIHIEISRTELKMQPKQRRKIAANAMIGDDFLKGYEIVTT